MFGKIKKMLKDDMAMPYFADCMESFCITGWGVAPCAAWCGK